MPEGGEPVYLHVYDLSQGLARQLSLSIIGKTIDAIYHTGVVFFNKEYWFGGGIESSHIGGAPYGNPIQVLNLGNSEIPLDIFQDFLREISPRYTPGTYNLLKHNCNNFSDEVVNFLLGEGIPEHIVKLPQEVTSTPIGALLIPMLEQIESGLRHGGTGVSHPPQPIPYHASPSHLTTPPQSSIQPSAAASNSTAAAFNSTAAVPNFTATASNSSAAASNSSVAASNLTATVDRDERSGAKQEIVSTQVKVETSAVNLVSTGAEPNKDQLKMQMQAEIAREFAEVMASGRFGANEAAAVALMNVKKRHESLNLT